MYRVTRIPQVDAILGRDGPIEDWEAVRRFVRGRCSLEWRWRPATASRSNSNNSQVVAIRYLFCRMVGFRDVPLDLCQETLEKLKQLMVLESKENNHSSDKTPVMTRYDLSCVALYPWADAMGRRQQKRDTSRSQSRRGLNRQREEILLSIQSWDSLRKDELFHKALQKTQLILELWTDDGSVPFLHKLLEVGVPNFVIYLAARLFPEHLRQPDLKGRLPLHVVAEKAMERGIYRNEVWHFHEKLVCEDPHIISLLNKPTPLQLLCYMYPDAAFQSDSANQSPYRGYIPLESFLYSIPHHGSLRTGASISTANERVAEMLQDLECLVRTSPHQALEAGHPQSRLYPFLVPVLYYYLDFGVPSCPSTVENPIDNSQDGDCSTISQRLLLSMSYLLLRSDPNVLSVHPRRPDKKA